MKPVDVTMLVVGASAFVIAALEWMGVFHFRVEPQAFLLVGIVCVGRVMLRIKLRNAALQRQAMIDEVPKHPLGLMDDGPVEQAARQRDPRSEARLDGKNNPLLSGVPNRPLGILDDDRK